MVKFTAPPTCVSCFKQLFLQFLTPFATNKFPIILVKFLRILQVFIVHCKYIGGTQYCGWLCYVSNSSGVVLTTANGSVLSMTVQNFKYCHKMQLVEILITTFTNISPYQLLSMAVGSSVFDIRKNRQMFEILVVNFVYFAKFQSKTYRFI